MNIVVKCPSFFLLGLFLYVSCAQPSEKEPSDKTADIGLLTMSVPGDFYFSEIQGVDSYVAYLISEKKDTFNIEYGRTRIINKLFQSPPLAVPQKDREGMIKNLGKLPPIDEVVFSDSYKIDNIQNVFDRNFYEYDTIHGIVAKIIQPKRIGQGMTGCYIPELKDGKSFSIYALNLDSVMQAKGLRLFRSIKYK